MITLTDLCGELNNWFDVSRHFEKFTIADGAIDIASGVLQTGQYFRIVGSVFNDGVHSYPATDLKDETFTGAVWCMSVPPSVTAILSEINSWIEKYSNDHADSPFTSESFGGYSYSKETSNNSTGADAGSWQRAFRSRLNRWRKL